MQEMIDMGKRDTSTDGQVRQRTLPNGRNRTITAKVNMPET